MGEKRRKLRFLFIYCLGFKRGEKKKEKENENENDVYGQSPVVTVAKSVLFSQWGHFSPSPISRKQAEQAASKCSTRPKSGKVEWMRKAGGRGDTSWGCSEKAWRSLPAGRIPMCCWPSNTKLPIGWPSGLYAAPWLTEGSRRKPDCSHSRTQRRKKKRYTTQSAIVPAASRTCHRTMWMAL